VRWRYGGVERRQAAIAAACPTTGDQIALSAHLDPQDAKSPDLVVESDPARVRQAGPQRREALEGNELLLVDVLVSEISR